MSLVFEALKRHGLAQAAGPGVDPVREAVREPEAKALAQPTRSRVVPMALAGGLLVAGGWWLFAQYGAGVAAPARTPRVPETPGLASNAMSAQPARPEVPLPMPVATAAVPDTAKVAVPGAPVAPAAVKAAVPAKAVVPVVAAAPELTAVPAMPHPAPRASAAPLPLPQPAPAGSKDPRKPPAQLAVIEIQRDTDTAPTQPVQRKAAEVAQDNVQGMFQVFMRHAESGQLEQAQSDVDELAKNLGKNHVLVLRAQGYVALLRGDLKQSQASYLQLLDQLPGDREAGMNAALIDFRLGNKDNATRRMARLSERYPDDPAIRSLSAAVKQQ